MYVETNVTRPSNFPAQPDVACSTRSNPDPRRLRPGLRQLSARWRHVCISKVRRKKRIKIKSRSVGHLQAISVHGQSDFTRALLSAPHHHRSKISPPGLPRRPTARDRPAPTVRVQSLIARISGALDCARVAEDLLVLSASPSKVGEQHGGVSEPHVTSFTQASDGGLLQTGELPAQAAPNRCDRYLAKVHPIEEGDKEVKVRGARNLLGSAPKPGRPGSPAGRVRGWHGPHAADGNVRLVRKRSLSNIKRRMIHSESSRAEELREVCVRGSAHVHESAPYTAGVDR